MPLYVAQESARNMDADYVHNLSSLSLCSLLHLLFFSCPRFYLLILQVSVEFQPFPIVMAATCS